MKFTVTDLKAAKALGLSRTMLYKKIKDLKNRTL